MASGSDIIRKLFWSELKSELATVGFVSINEKVHSGWFVKFRPSGTASKYAKYDIRISENGIQISFCLDIWKHQDRDPHSHKARKQFFTKLLSYRQEIETRFGEGLLIWDGVEKDDIATLYSIKTKRHACQPFVQSEWPEIFEIIKKVLREFHASLAPYLFKVGGETEIGELARKFSLKPELIRNIYRASVVISVVLRVTAVITWFYLPFTWWILLFFSAFLISWKVASFFKGMGEGFMTAWIFPGTFLLVLFSSTMWSYFSLFQPDPPTAQEIERNKMKQQRVSCIITARNAVKRRLSNPYSAKFSNEFPCKKTADGYFIQRGWVNAKNAFGGYAGPKEFVATIKDGRVIHLNF